MVVNNLKGLLMRCWRTYALDKPLFKFIYDIHGSVYFLLKINKNELFMCIFVYKMINKFKISCKSSKNPPKSDNL